MSEEDDLTMLPGTSMWLKWTGWTNIFVGGFALFYPAFLGSPAYGWATAVLPFQAWGVLMLVIGALSLISEHRADYTMATVALGLSMWVQFMFGLSVLALTLTGVTSAISGAIQWWTSARISAWFLKRGL